MRERRRPGLSVSPTQADLRISSQEPRMNAAEAHRRPSFRDATRVLSSLLSPLEKRVLLFLAARIPPWINSDHLTGLAMAAMLGAGLSFWAAASQREFVWLVVVCLALNWFGDSLDGTLARFR